MTLFFVYIKHKESLHIRLIRLLAIVGLPHTFCDLHVRKNSREGRFLRRTSVYSETDLVSSAVHVADAHLAEINPVSGAFNAKVIFAAREAVPHGFHIGRYGGGSPI